MLSTKDVAAVYETLLSSPGMEGTVKVTLSLSRKDLLVLTKVIEQGIAQKDQGGEGSLLSVVDGKLMEEMERINAFLLDKGGLTELNDRLGRLSAK